MKSLQTILLFLFVSIYGCSQSEESIKMDEISYSFINNNVLEMSGNEFNLIFFIAGKSCSACTGDVVKYVNEFERGKFHLTVVSNDDVVKETLNEAIPYLQFEQLELERHGFRMSDSEIYVFIEDNLVYNNIVTDSEYEHINSKMKALND